MKLRRKLVTLLLLAQSGCFYGTLVPVVYQTTAPNQLATANLSFCEGAAPSTETLLKFIFVVDQSGVNESFDGQSDLGTDASGDQRYGTIESFLQYESNNPQVYFALVGFNDNASVQSTSSKTPLTKAGFQANAAFESIIQNKWHGNNGLPVGDGGWSNYENALNTVNSLINSDITQARQDPNKPTSAYFVVYISGGEPLTAWSANPPPKGTYTRQDDSTGMTVIQGQIINSILAHQAGDSDVVQSIIFDTAYYYAAGTFSGAALSLLELMANWGNGINLILGQGNTINFNDFQMPQFHLQRVLKDVFVVNENAVWWQGQLLQDSDNDGLPDALEVQLGSDPNNWDSDGDGVSDGVEYFATGKPCQSMNSNGTCAAATPNSMCSQFILSTYPTLTMKDTDGDGLNDCEEQLLHSSPTMWDSNLDWIPDRIELRGGIAFLAGYDDSQSDPDNDGMTNYFEMKYFTPALFNNSLITNLHPYQYELQMTSAPGANPVCYNLTVSNITYFSPTDSIRAYVEDNTGGKNSQRFLRTGAKPLNNGTVTFQDSDLGAPISQ